MEIQVEILRHLLRRDYPIKLCPLDSESDPNWGFGSLGILRTSRHLSNLSLGVLYGENTFKLLKKVHLVLEDSEPEPNIVHLCVCAPLTMQLVADFQCSANEGRTRAFALEHLEGYSARHNILRLLTGLPGLDIPDESWPRAAEKRQRRDELSYDHALYGRLDATDPQATASTRVTRAESQKKGLDVGIRFLVYNGKRQGQPPF